MMEFELAGLCSVQDPGRPGLQNQGIGESGAMDRFALRVANSLLGNEEHTGAIEITCSHVRIRTHNAQWFALTGADLCARVNGQVFPLCRPVFVETNSELGFSKPLWGCRAYLAVQGGFDLKPVLGSVATDARSGLGGLNGRWLAKHDRIAFGRPLQYAGRQAHWHTHYANPAFTRPGPLRLVPGSLWQHPGGVDTKGFLARQWHIAPDSDRMGIRLAETLTRELPGTPSSSVPDPRPDTVPGGSVLSSAVAFGSVQLPPDQRPIILAADRQTTGGYPLLGTLASMWHSALAQLKPGDEVRFELIEVTEAQADWCRRELSFRRWQANIRNWWQSAYVGQISP
jgi:antagonist of KipI